AVPRGEAQVLVEHDHAVAHIVEGDAQFRLALADLVEQASILHRDHCLCGRILRQRDLIVREWPDFPATDRVPTRATGAAEAGGIGRVSHDTWPFSPGSGNWSSRPEAAI